MFVDNKKIYIHHKQTLSPYANANKDHLVSSTKTLGSTLNAVNKMLASGEEMKTLLPEILGVSSNSPNWDSRVSYYWNSISENIDPNGRALEIGYIFDIDSPDTKSYVDNFNKIASSDNKLNTSEDIAKYFKKSYDKIIEEFNKSITASRKLPTAKDSDKALNEAYHIKYDKLVALESQKYKYGKPVNVADYLLYRFCLVHSQVANEYDLVDKSQNIRFYLHSEEEIKQYKEKQVQLEKERMSVFLDVVKSPDNVENLLYALGLGYTIKDLDEVDRNMVLNTHSVDNPKSFITTANNKNLQTIGLIEKYITFGILRRLESSSIIIDAVDPSVTVGNNMDEALQYFKDKKNEAYLSELNARFKGLPKN